MFDYVKPETLNIIATYGILFAAIATAIATFALWRVTKILAVETQRMADFSAKPQIVASLLPNKWSIVHFDIEVENTGNATAFDIEIKFDPELVADKSNDRGEPVAFQTLSILKPGQKLSSFLGNYEDYKGVNFTVTTSWKPLPSDEHRETMKYTLSMADYDHVTYLGERDPIVQIAQETRKLREAATPVLKGRKRLKTDTYTQKDRDEHNRKNRERYEAMKKQRDQS